ncbi:MAG: four helix bundle protein [Candidatus Wildermuthbacteria bacterium RIFCSPLOWO2_01_FULL_48_29]|uniref:Four helix bundle protein n=1 Tax=Candidatus Wildermuthbacteria bacterium RIFCSPLOWO2_01_FULL_48_29 TaxID=1802462 RepID=A0A1G2RMN8_9BACT|nr:MAG: four helix bundle protein [Candidatus Wildermuthbacteria bacterium RIFCSPLOWO2_01_FULL_48_29]
MTETNEKKYDLEERTARFGEDTIMFAKTLEKDVIMMPLISQLVRAATSVGANYMEANQASSKRDFRNKIYICKKEANETKHWLRMISKASPAKADDCRKFWKEAHELTLIFSKIATSLNDTKV